MELLEEIPAEQIRDWLDEMREAFNMIDVNGDGQITKQDFSRLLDILGQRVTDREMDEMWRTIDTNMNGLISFTEFIKLALLCNDIEDREVTLREAFLMFDRNRDGNLTHEEVGYVMNILGAKLDKVELQELSNMIEKQFGGCITFQQFSEVFGRYKPE